MREPIGGRQVAHIVPDPERAPLVKAVFELYATGEWTVERLAEEMAHRGLRNRGRDGLTGAGDCRRRNAYRVFPPQIAPEAGGVLFGAVLNASH